MTNFLKNLKESLDSGVPNEAIVAGFGEIISKADTIGSDQNRLKEAQEKVEKSQELRKPLTAEEIKELESIAIKQQERIYEFEFQTMLQGVLVNIDLAIEKLLFKIQDFYDFSAQLRDTTISVSNKKVIIKDLQKKITDLEVPIKSEKFMIDDNAVIYGENKIVYDKNSE